MDDLELQNDQPGKVKPAASAAAKVEKSLTPESCICRFTGCGLAEAKALLARLPSAANVVATYKAGADAMNELLNQAQPKPAKSRDKQPQK